MPKLMEVLEFLDNTGSVMVARTPAAGECEIKWGAQLTVRESQVAIFFRDGQSLATFGPGRHVLKTPNIPVLSKFVTSFGYGENSPFRAEVYFLSTKLFRNLKWGTREAIVFRDPELDIIRLRAFGAFSIQIIEPEVFLNRIVGTQGIFLDTDIHDYLRNIITSRLINLFGEHLKSIFDLPRYYDSLGAAVKAVCALDFKACGLELSDLFINSISPTEEVQKIIDERTQMKAIGSLDSYMRFKTAKAIEASASNESTATGVGMGIGMGVILPTIQNLTNSGQQNDVYSEIKKLKELLDAKAITQAEYEVKKKEFLGRL